MSLFTIGLVFTFILILVLYYSIILLRKNYTINHLDAKVFDLEYELKIIKDELDKESGFSTFWKLRHDDLLKILVKHGILDLQINGKEYDVKDIN